MHAIISTERDYVLPLGDKLVVGVKLFSSRVRGELARLAGGEAKHGKKKLGPKTGI